MSTLSKSLLLIAVLTVAACQSVPLAKNWQQSAENKPAFDASGRLAVKQQDKGSYANFDWSSNQHKQQLDVNTPLGNTVGQLCLDRLGVVAIASDGSQFQAHTASELSQRLLGFEVQLEALDVWLHGHWHSNSAHSVDAQGRLQQDGWTISRYLDAQGQPKELLLERPELSLRLLLTHYESPSTMLEGQTCERE